MKEITIRIINPRKKHGEIKGDTGFQIIIDGVPQSHVKRFAIDIDDEKN